MSLTSRPSVIEIGPGHFALHGARTERPASSAVNLCQGGPVETDFPGPIAEARPDASVRAFGRSHCRGPSEASGSDARVQRRQARATRQLLAHLLDQPGAYELIQKQGRIAEALLTPR